MSQPEAIALQPHHAWNFFRVSDRIRELNHFQYYLGSLPAGHDWQHDEAINKLRKALDSLPPETPIVLSNNPDIICHSCPKNPNGIRFNLQDWGSDPCDTTDEKLIALNNRCASALRLCAGEDLTVGHLQRNVNR